LLTPEDDAELPAVGKVTFKWTALEGADSYLLTFTLPSGETVDFEIDGTTRDRYMEAFAGSGEYQWNVTALAADGNQICSSDFFAFTTPASPANAPQGDGGSGGSSGGCPPDCGWDGGGGPGG
jgi:hypothetical protein